MMNTDIAQYGNFYDFMLDSMRSGGPQGHAKTPEMSVDKKSGVITVGQYEIHVKKDSVKILDTESGKWIEAWGDPHLKTSDGDKAQFHTDNLTIDLPNGVKLTIVPTEQKKEGAPTYVDQLAVMTEDQSLLVNNIHDKEGPQFGPLEKATGALDEMFEDGTVLYVKDELDDLFFAATDEELKHTKGGELDVDGKGGDSLNDFTEITGDMNFDGLDIYTILFLIMGRVEEQEYAAAKNLQNLQNRREKRDRLLEKNSQVEGYTLPKNLQGLDSKISLVTSQLQRLEQYKQQLNTMISNLSKSEHEMKMVTLRNIPTR